MYLSNSGFQDEVRDSSFLYHTWRSSYFYVTFSIAKLVWILKRKTTKYLLILSGLHDCLDNRGRFGMPFGYEFGLDDYIEALFEN